MGSSGRQKTTWGRRNPGPRLVVAAASAIAGVLLLWVASTQSARADDHQADRAELDLISIRTDVARAQRDDMTAQMAQPFGLVSAEDVAAASAARVVAVAEGRAALLDIDIDPGIGPERYELLVDAFDAWVPPGPTAAPFELYNGANVIEFDARPPYSDPVTVMDAMQQLAWLDVGSQFVLQETLIVEFDQREMTAGPGLAEFFGLAAAFISGEQQVFGPDGADPLAGGAYWIDGAATHEGAVVEQVTSLLTETDLWAADRRNGAFVPGTPTEGTVDLASLYSQSMSTTEAIRVLVDQRLESRLDASASAAEAADARAALARYGATAFLAVALAALVFSIAGHWRRSRELRNRVNIDPLTGVGNRNLLESKTRKLLADTEFSHHVAVMVDMDRFKMVNDTYGHAAGDALLCDVASGLQAVVEALNVTDSAVVRLGGDEFTLTLHDRSAIDVEALIRQLDRLRAGSTAVDRGRSVPMSFSYGIARGSTGASLDDLLEAADLAAYEQKAQRRQVPASIDISESAPVD